MERKTLLSLFLGVATGGALGVGATVQAQVARSDVREPFGVNTVDGFCVFVDKSQVDAGVGGAVVRSKFDGARVEARATLLPLVPDEDPSSCQANFKLTGQALTDVQALFTSHIRGPLKTACRMP